MTRFSLPDLIDIDFFLSRGALDEGIVESIAADKSLKNTSERVRAWLEAEREAFHNRDLTMFPGTIVVHGITVFTITCLLVALGSGLAVSGHLLTYDGVHPINVGLYFTVLVIAQFVMSVAVLVAMFARIFFGKVRLGTYPLLWLVLQRSVSFCASFFDTDGQSRVSPVDLLRRSYQKYSFFMIYKLATIVQMAAVFFNVIVIANTLWLVSTRDIAFAWQTTLEVDSTFVSQVVHYIAAPWSWIGVEPFAVPTSEQILGSRVVLKDGIIGLQSDNLSSWWPFLCLSVIVYGLFPRLILWLFGVYFMHQEGANLVPKGVEYRKLEKQFHQPRISVSGPQPAELRYNPDIRQNQDFSRPMKMPIHVITSKSLLTRVSKDTILTSMRNRDYQGEFEVTFATIDEQPVLKKDSDNIFFQEAWQPPIAELKEQIGVFVKQSERENIRLLALLLGKSSEVKWWGEASEIQCGIWNQCFAEMSSSIDVVIASDFF